MSSKNKREKRNHAKIQQNNDVPQKEIQRSHHQQITATEQRPAQLAPELIAKYSPDNVNSIVESFNKSIEYQSETNRNAMEKHYKHLDKNKSKEMVLAFSVIIGLYGYLYFSKIEIETWGIIVFFLFFIIQNIRGLEIFSKISSYFKKKS